MEVRIKMHLKFAIIDDSLIDTQYAANLVKKWAVTADHTVCIQEFFSAEEILFHYED